MSRYKLYFLSCVCMLGMACSSAAQDHTRVIMRIRGDIDKTTGQTPWLITMLGCLDVATERINNDYPDLLQQAKDKRLSVQLTVKTDVFDIQTYLAAGTPGDDVIINFYGTLLSETDTGKNNCKGVLWVGSVPPQLR